MLPHPVNNIQIKGYFQNDLNSRNNLPNIANDRAYVVNLVYKLTKTHLISFYVNGNT